MVEANRIIENALIELRDQLSGCADSVKHLEAVASEQKATLAEH